MKRIRVNVRRGIAIAMVMIALALITALVVEIIYRSQVAASIVVNRRDSEKAYELARAAFRWSIFRLELDTALDKIPEIPGTNYGGRKDDLAEFQWAFPLPYPFSAAALLGAPEGGEPLDTGMKSAPVDIGGSFISTVKDESARINLNDVGSGGPPGNIRWSGAAEILENLFLSPRFRVHFQNIDHRELLWAIDDWTDTDSQVNHLGGGVEDSEYQGDDVDLHVKNSPFFSVDEIRFLKPMTEELFRELRPFITVYPFQARIPRISSAPVTPMGKINVNTAPLEVIAALFSREVLPDMKDRLVCAQEVVKYRANVVFRSIPAGKEPSLLSAVAQLCGLIQEQGAPPIFTPEVNRLLSVRSDTFRIEATGLVEQAEKTVLSVVSRQNPSQPRILYWKVL